MGKGFKFDLKIQWTTKQNVSSGAADWTDDNFFNLTIFEDLAITSRENSSINLTSNYFKVQVFVSLYLLQDLVVLIVVRSAQMTWK